MATLAIQAGQEFPATGKLRRFREFAMVARTTRSLNKLDGEQGLFPGTRGIVRFGHLSCGALPAMADYAAPLFHIVACRRVRPILFGGARCALAGFFCGGG